MPFAAWLAAPKVKWAKDACLGFGSFAASSVLASVGLPAAWEQDSFGSTDIMAMDYR